MKMKPSTLDSKRKGVVRDPVQASFLRQRPLSSVCSLEFTDSKSKPQRRFQQRMLLYADKLLAPFLHVCLAVAKRSGNRLAPGWSTARSETSSCPALSALSQPASTMLRTGVLVARPLGPVLADSATLREYRHS